MECWGWNKQGQADPPDSKFVSLSSGAFHSCGIHIDGAVECWGLNRDGEANPPEGLFTSISAGAHHTCGIHTDGAVECWGWNKQGQADPPDSKFVSLSSGRWHTCGILIDGAEGCWGDPLRPQYEWPRLAREGPSPNIFSAPTDPGSPFEHRALRGMACGKAGFGAKALIC